MIARSIQLPAPTRTLSAGSGQLDDVVAARHSVRRFDRSPLTLVELGAVLWCAYGQRADGGRTVPSAHGLYPLQVTVLVAERPGAEIAAGAYRYRPAKHALDFCREGDHVPAVSATSLADEEWIGQAPVVLLVSCDVDALAEHFRDQPGTDRSERYAWLEFGHLSQNTYLAATALGLGACLVAGIDDERSASVNAAIAGTENPRPLGLLTLGRSAATSPGR